MQIITIILLISTLAFGWYTCADIFRYILQQRKQHVIDKIYWQIRRKKIREQANKKVKNPTQEREFHENHKN